MLPHNGWMVIFSERKLGCSYSSLDRRWLEPTTCSLRCHTSTRLEEIVLQPLTSVVEILAATCDTAFGQLKIIEISETCPSVKSAAHVIQLGLELDMNEFFPEIMQIRAAIVQRFSKSNLANDKLKTLIQKLKAKGPFPAE
eukprot:TRINITY_DN4667_c0_g1_i1.p1 TRINITY_DN4667_c0_g1~~TRINITY_DN4667_c0_g1_i1.p1  ORF type:complete len:141 (-),score=39.16 TRINITY_DN4667_c0_g1_i1:507-929(-)